MGYHDYLHLIRVFLNVSAYSCDVYLVQCGFDFVKNTERRRIYLDERKKQCNRYERLLSAGQKIQILYRFSGRSRVYLDSGFKRVFGICEYYLRVTAAEQLTENLAEILVYFSEGFHEYALHVVLYADENGKQILP